MTTTILTIIIFISFILYFSIMWFTMRYTFNFETLNKYIFRIGLKKRDLMHYVELAMVIITLIGILTTMISLIQIIIKQRKNKHD